MNNARIKLCLFLVFMALFAVSVPVHAANPAVNGAFPIGIHFNPSSWETTNAKYAEIADMNANFILGTNFVDTFDETDKALNYAAANGLKMIVDDGRMNFNSREHVTQLETGRVVQLTSTSPVGQTFYSGDWNGHSTFSIRLDESSLSTTASISVVVYPSPARGPIALKRTLTGPFTSQDLTFDIYAGGVYNYQYYYELTTDSTEPIGILASNADAYTRGQAYVNSVAQPFDLMFDAEFSSPAYWDGERPLDATIDEIANHYKNNPAVLGYNIIDEPSATMYAQIKETSDRLKLTDPDSINFVNLFPNYADPHYQLGMMWYHTGENVSSSMTLGQTFKTRPSETYIDYISLYLDHTTWSTDENLTLSLWDSPAKQTLLADTTIGGADGETWISIPLNATVSPDTTYYWELTHNGGGDNKVENVIRSANGHDWFSDGTGYMNGAAIDADFYYAVNQSIIGRAYEDYVNQYVALNPDVVAFDHYPFQYNGQNNQAYFENLEIIRRQALLGDVNFWSYIQSVSITNSLRLPTESEMKYQVYTNLAYGAKGIIYFTYETPPFSGFNNGLILPGGAKNVSYTWAKNLNAEVLNLGSALLSLTSKDVYHTGDLPSNTKELPSSYFWQPSGSGPEMPMIVSRFENEDGREYVMVVNKDMQNSHSQSFALSTLPDSVKEVSKTTGLETTTAYNAGTGVLSADFAPGEGRLYVLDEEAPASAELKTTITGVSPVQAGNKFTVKVGLSGVTGSVYAQDIKLDYDPAVMEFVSAKSLKPGIKVVRTIKEPVGKLRLLIASEGAGHGITGTEEIVELTFKAKAATQPASGVISISSATLGDAGGNESEAASSSLSVLVTTGGSGNIPGDINHDGKVSVGDLSIVAANYGKNSSSPDWEQVKQADLNKDGKIDIEDLAAVARRIAE
ncbi:cohesin domain-containing protein [Paenibacillus eucommiae]|uniref:Dockerin domain-containing protein n=1 Tax=Paenibacillus eucommiae TaxID=1355755 RepID=A0ABS4J5N6_9BACL|nr:cohesin domain-containing protein [Paenibacillus eucommiae]MBP1995157.1 hypothetical protein [Paenibacillus eucommiae]